MYLTNNTPDIGSILPTLFGIIRDFNDPVDQYLHHIEEYEVFNPFQSNVGTDCMRIGKPVPYGLCENLGIRRLTFNNFHCRSAMPDHWYREELRTLFSDCAIIEFADWAEADDASDIWDGLYSDVIKPLNKRDFQFIFHLGDITKRLVFEVDEILDIVGDYSSHGRVTLMLDDYEADKLWSRLNGVLTSDFRPQEAKEKYRFLFNTMNIDVLLILHSNRAELFSRDWQFDLAGRSLVGIREPNARVRFSVGYQLGLLLQLEIPHCIALGLIVSEVYTDQASGPGSKLLLDYMHDWMAVLLSNVHENTYL